MSEINSNAAAEATAPVVAAPLTRAEKYAKQIELLSKRIEADTAKLVEVKLEAETAEKLAGVNQGSAVRVKLGRAETTREVNARVVGVKDEDNGSRKFKILFGEALDMDTAIIQESQIVAVLEAA